MVLTDKRLGRFLFAFGVFSCGLYLSAGVAHAQAEVQAADPYHCVRKPKFIQTAGMQQPVAIDTKQSRLPGVVIRELKGAKRSFRHPTWSQSGHVASTIRDSNGNIYAVPFPSISLDINPLEKRNTVYKIDSITGEMTPFVHLPLIGEHSQQNPFGTMGVTLDCDTNSIYVSSVANSSPNEVNGVIYQVNIDTAQIESRLSGVDAMGVGIFDAGNGKRIYFGDARSSSIYSLPLLKNGDFSTQEQPRHELSLLEVKNGDSTQVRKIVFVKDKQYGYKLVATETEFSFRLLAESGRRFRDYEFLWNASTGRWIFNTIR